MERGRPDQESVVGTRFPVPGDNPNTIVVQQRQPIILGDAVLASKMADALLERGIYVIAFSYPVVPKGKARIRCQVSAAHSREDLDFAIEQFAAVRQELGP